MIYTYIKQLVNYGIKTGLLPECERVYATNLLLDIMQESYYEDPGVVQDAELEDILAGLLDEAVSRGIIEDSIAYRDLFDTRLMNAICPRPEKVRIQFDKLRNESSKAATDYFYKLSQDSDYIRRYRIKKDIRWVHPSSYGDIDISINLSKPEKDPRAIAAAGKASTSCYPDCLLCMENEGYAGRLDHPARENHRIVPLTLGGEDWFFQYSPYVYYNEHCIIFNSAHIPMKIDRGTFRKLLDFVKQFPHYILGSNADLPIVGGSILSHDHFQGGSYEFPMARAQLESKFTVAGFEDISCGIVRWPLSVIRISGKDDKKLVELADYILGKWRAYTDEAAFIFARTGDEPHNTITPIARMRDDKFELDLTLRNNITTDEHPLGVYHPHAHRHNIKKENIGLIEVMGLAILPARLRDEMEVLAKIIADGGDPRASESTAKHAQWVESFLPKYKDITHDNAMDILRKEIGNTFVGVLEDAGVYKCTDEGRKAFERFTRTL